MSYDRYKQYLHELQVQDRHRKLRADPILPKGSIVDFSSNDYLKLSQQKELLIAAYEAGRKYGVGATGSRLLSGNRAIFAQLEQTIAQDKGTESALILNSGFQTNVTILSALLDSKVLKATPLVFFDKYNHASLYQGIFLSGAKCIRYHHHDLDHLAKNLALYKEDPAPKFIVTETLFGMDGDIVDLKKIVALAKEYGAFLYLDEAHAVGLIGKKGYGLSTLVECKDVPHVIMGTFSKALGGSGGYVACDSSIRDYLINKTVGFIYSTANSPMVIGAALAAWKKIAQFEQRREDLFSSAARLRKALQKQGWETGKSCSPIIPIIVGTESFAMQMQEFLFQKGILVSCIRPPTVPPGSSRIRIALNVSHTEQEIDRLLEGCHVFARAFSSKQSSSSS